MESEGICKRLREDVHAALGLRRSAKAVHLLDQGFEVISKGMVVVSRLECYFPGKME